MFEKIFGLSKNGTTVRTELVAGLTTFMTMAYILAVNPNILAAAGIPKGGVFMATAVAAVVGTLLMAFLSNYPFVLAPGMGLNAFFAFGVVIGMGYSWQFALLTVFVEGLIFLALSLTPVREGIFNSIPMSLKRAVAAGIGLFICFIALQTAKIVVKDDATFVALVNFNHVDFHTHGVTALLALVGTLLTGVMLVKKWKGAILLGIFVTWALGMLAQASGIYVPDPAKGFFSTYPSFTIGDVANSFKEFGSTIDFFVVMFAFFFMDLFDTLGTLIGVSLKGGFLDKSGRLPRISGALCADSIATSVGAVLGTSTTTTYVESASGVAVGGKTGLVAVTAAALFALAILFAPIFLAIPGFATTPALIIVGYMMISSCADIEWHDAGEAVPAFLSITAMPFTYSISDSIMFGVISYTVINALAGNFRRIHWIMYVLTAVFVAKFVLM